LGRIDVHLPFITLVLSSHRECRLLLAGKTEVERSLGSIALDTAGTGGGAAIGAKLGALIGTGIVPGLGTAIGGIDGALAGAVTGRLTTHRLRRASLMAAVQAYNDAHARLSTQVTLAEGQTQYQYAAAVEFEEVALAKRGRIGPAADRPTRGLEPCSLG